MKFSLVTRQILEKEDTTSASVPVALYANTVDWPVITDMDNDSDIDIMVEIAPDARIGLFQYVGIVHYLEDMFPVRVDVANREGLKPLVRPSAERDAIYAF